MVAEAADALPGTRNGADAEAASTALREIFMPLPDLILLSLRLLLREITLQRAPAPSHTQYDRLDGRAQKTGTGKYTQTNFGDKRRYCGRRSVIESAPRQQPWPAARTPVCPPSLRPE